MQPGSARHPHKVPDLVRVLKLLGGFEQPAGDHLGLDLGRALED
ncbi:hypothetical protein MEME101129_14065 [Methylobacterium mesophilicum]